MIDKQQYEEYKDSLLNISRLTNKENSVLISFKVLEDVCTCVVEFIQQDGTKDIIKDSKFICNDGFYKEFLETFVVDYYNNMNIAFSDNIDMNADGRYTYRLVTLDNDMLSIDGISLEYANHLVSLIENKKKKVTDISSNEAGVATLFITLVLLGGIGISFLLMILLLG